jgi:Holliday junction DNA helicase RuvA
MIAYLSGQPQAFTTDSIILQANQVGFQVFLPLKTHLAVLKQASVKLFIYTHVREDTLELYGFNTLAELRLFKLIISISGIGPKIAIHLIDQGVSAIEEAVINADLEFFTAVPRLGRKNAQKIIIELKSKLGSLKELDLAPEPAEIKEAVNALVSLGFSQKQARQALRQATKPEDALEVKITKAIKYFGQPKK